MEKAQRILSENVVDYPAFYKIMTETFASPAVAESYRKDRDWVLQLTDRLYTEELLEIPGSRWRRKWRRALLRLLYLLSPERREASGAVPCRNGEKKREREHT